MGLMCIGMYLAIVLINNIQMIITNIGQLSCSGFLVVSMYQCWGSVYLSIYSSYYHNHFLLAQVKQIMEEAVTKKFIHEDSASVTTLCGNLLTIFISKQTCINDLRKL